MAKSIYVTLQEEEFEVSHNGEDVKFQSPEWMRAFTPEVMESEEECVRIATENDMLHGLIHLGLQQAIIGMRAKARPADKNGEKISITGEVEFVKAEERLNAYRPKPISRPGKKKEVSPADALAALKASGMSKEEILAKIAEML